MKVFGNLANFCVAFHIFNECYLNNNQICALKHLQTGLKPFVTNIKYFPKNSQKQYKIEQSAVILCNDLKDIAEFNNRVVLSNRYPKKLKFIVICEKSIMEKFSKPHQLKNAEGSIVEF
jgi:hypothetical protein